ncbi:MAG: T9SS type A sorting domain-containing protein [Bacteroidia bacterium]
MIKNYPSSLFYKIIFTIAFAFCFFNSNAQYANAVIDDQLTNANEYGTANSNTYTSGGQTWHLTWDADTLYVMVRNANIYESVIMYFDFNPIVPVNGGNNTNGNLTGYFAEGLTPNLPFRADAFLYSRCLNPSSNFGIIGNANGTGGWLGVGFGNNALGSGVNDVSDGFVASGNISGEDRREFKIAWAHLKGSAGVPSSFNWFGYCAYNCSNTCGGIYGQVPSANPSGSLPPNSTPDMVRYFTVSTTANGSATNPVSRDSYTHLGSIITNFGNISCYDFTMNTPGQFITRLTGAGFKDWTIDGTLVVNNGSIYFGGYNAAYGITDYGATTINNLLISGGELNFDYDTYVTLVTGDVTQTGGLFYLGDRTNANQGDLEVRGNWNRTGGTFGINHKAVFFRGTSLQNISGIGTHFPYVEINNAAGISLVSGNDTIQDTLWLVIGNVSLANNNLTIEGLNGQTVSSTGAISGGSSNSFIVTDGTGVLEQRQVGPTVRSTSILYPIGNSSTDYRPVTITNTGTTDNITARVFSTVWTGGTNGAGTQISTDYVDRTWVLGETVTGGSNLDLSFQYAGADELTSFDRTNCAIVYHNGGSWITTQAYGPVAGGNPYTRAVSGISNLGDFSIQSVLLSPLPVNLVAFNAELKGNDGNVYWTTTNEINADHFILERSVDGINFSEISTQTAQTQSTVFKNYYYLDKNINRLGTSVIYYRLREVDKNGSQYYSQIIALKLKDNTVSDILNFFPNPCIDQFVISYFSDKDDEITLDIYSSTGAIVCSVNFEVSEGINQLNQTQLNDIAQGIYFVKITNHQRQINYKFVKQ